jgi:hypothetical protein
LFCPGPSSLSRPHPPHSQAHRDFTARRLIRDAFAVRERLGDPRVVPSFRCTFLPGMPSSPTPGSSTSICSRASTSTWPSPFDQRLGTPKIPAIRFTRATHYVASLVRFCYGLPDGSPPCADRTGNAPALGDFYFQAFDGSVTLPVAGYNYNSDWTPLLAGFSPAGMAASFAARSKCVMPDGDGRGSTAFKTGRHGPRAPTARRDRWRWRQDYPRLYVLSLKRRLTLDVTARVARIGRAEPQTRRASREPS